MLRGTGNLPDSLRDWANEGVRLYRNGLLWPDCGDTPEAVVCHYLRDKLVNCCGYRVRMEGRATGLVDIAEGVPYSPRAGTRKQRVDIVYGKNDKIVGLIEVKRVFPGLAHDRDAIRKDIKKLQNLRKDLENLKKESVAIFLVIQMGSTHDPITREQIARGLTAWRAKYGPSIVSAHDSAQPTNGEDRYCWAILVLDASTMPTAE